MKQYEQHTIRMQANNGWSTYQTHNQWKAQKNLTTYCLMGQRIQSTWWLPMDHKNNIFTRKNNGKIMVTTMRDRWHLFNTLLICWLFWSANETHHRYSTCQMLIMLNYVCLTAANREFNHYRLVMHNCATYEYNIYIHTMNHIRNDIKRSLSFLFVTGCHNQSYWKTMIGALT